MTPLVDSFGRVHTYLRLSVTDRCNFRCTYCMPQKEIQWTPRHHLLSFEEIERLARIFVELGIHKIRLTGGEPTARAGLTQLVGRLSAIPGLRELAMTTNGHNMDRLAGPLAQAGLTRVNISIDSLQSERFEALTGGGSLRKVLRGIRAARLAGLSPVRLNAVMLEGENESEVMDLVRFVEEHPTDLELRFIEYMPFEVRAHQCVTGERVRAMIQQERTLVPWSETGQSSGPATLWRCHETGLRVGFIAPLSSKFCSSCNRLRLQASGQLRTCLAHEDTPSLRDLMRNGSTDAHLKAAIRQMVLGKAEGHACTVKEGQPFQGIMTGIGG